MTLDELLALCEKATPGPWTEKHTQHQCVIVHQHSTGERILAVLADWCLENGFNPPSHVDAAFIAPARAALPELARRQKRLRELLPIGEKWDGWTMEKIIEFRDLIHGELP